MNHKIKEQIIKNYKWIVLVICLIGFSIILKKVISKETINLDIIGYQVISNTFTSEITTYFAKIITNLGGSIALITLTAILFTTIKNKKIGQFIIINLCTAATINFILKIIIQRPRPTEHRLINQIGYSFPSGHSMVSMAFYGLIIYIIYKHIKNKYIKTSLITLLSILIILIGTSRIYLGVHYTSDVIAGYLIAIAYLIIYITIIKNN